MYNSTRFNNLLSISLDELDEADRDSNPFIDAVDQFEEQIKLKHALEEDGKPFIVVAFKDGSFSFVTAEGYAEVTPEDKEYKQILLSLMIALKKGEK
jgi:hypothetical protein